MQGEDYGLLYTVKAAVGNIHVYIRTCGIASDAASATATCTCRTVARAGSTIIGLHGG